MAFKIFVFIATLAVAKCSPLSQTVCESQTVPNFLPRPFPYMPFPGRNILNPGQTVCETAMPPVMYPSTTCCESNIPSMYPLPNIPSTTVCESTPTFNPNLPMNPSTTTVCESTPNIPSINPGGCYSNFGGLPNMYMNGLGLGMPGQGMGMPGLGMGMPGLGMGMPGLGMPSLLTNVLGMPGMPNLGLAGLINMGLPMPLITNLLTCLGVNCM